MKREKRELGEFSIKWLQILKKQKNANEVDKFE